MIIRQLPEAVVNRIAAGEVIERPASVAKELIENAVDAGARRIDVSYSGGGLAHLRVSDDGMGMSAEELPLAISRHCTSKLGDDIQDIRALGFRGEALPSIGSVARLSISSRQKSTENGWRIDVEGGRITPVKPTAMNFGTIVEVRDLFFAVPGRLKFMKSERAENTAIIDVVRRMALAFPHIYFSTSQADGRSLNYPACASTKDDSDAALKERCRQILGDEFTSSTIPLHAERDGKTLFGRISVPSFSRGNALQQFVFVNGRPVKDRALSSALAGAYADALPRGRFASVVLFLECEPRFVDVNVHPAKADVRFRDAGAIRGLIIGAIRQKLAEQGLSASGKATQSLAAAFRREDPQSQPVLRPFDASTSWQAPLDQRPALNEQEQSPFTPSASNTSITNEAMLEESHFLGAAKAQVHKNYIVSQTQDGLVIVDQHAAHERLVYEALKQAMASKALDAQFLLVPDIVDLSLQEADMLLEQQSVLDQLGLKIESFGTGAIAVHATPAMLGDVNATALIRDLVDDLAEDHKSPTGAPLSLEHRLHYVAATMACHGSVRSGRLLKPDEMNALLRQMERTPGSGTCNHGRPTFIELGLKDIERLFGR